MTVAEFVLKVVFVRTFPIARTFVPMLVPVFVTNTRYVSVVPGMILLVTEPSVLLTVTPLMVMVATACASIG